ncbi:hypothetical protein AUJ66_00925 [Candidatus Desantisbacteria bacterium CG1_02_38_46]|uniref:Uncharacterized protein n=1 Tax=Candidatus Desantisbacteria bacterium CG1_02_38_46 TaxID=1817893 RepID=A0A1J4SKE4_9BACT|nr:MAG: hypothetical protein AUJ66_00925 [Candidatus Desantisbacteria bacterium CG1_02_38_46]
MRKNGLVVGILLGVMFMVALSYAGELTQIIIYKGETVGTGVGISSFKLVVGDEMFLTAKGADAEGNDVPIWPTWKTDKELSIKVVEGRSKTVAVKALKPGAPLFITAIYITDDGKKVTGEAMGEVKAAAKK